MICLKHEITCQDRILYNIIFDCFEELVHTLSPLSYPFHLSA